MQKILEGDPEDKQLNNHVEWTDHKAIIEHFKLNEHEKNLPFNSVLTTIYTKLAIKNLWLNS